MTTSTVTITGNVKDMIDGDFDSRRTKVFLKHNTDYIVDADEGVVRLGSATVSIDDLGAWTLPDVIASADSVTNLQATVYVDYADPMTRARKTQPFGPYDLSAETGTVAITALEAVQHLDASFVSVTMAQMQALLDAQEAVAGLTGEDDAVAYLFTHPSQTRDAADGRYVLEGSAFADIAKHPGVDNTGTTECAAAIQTALDGFAALGVRAYAKGTFKIASTITIASNADLSDALFNYTGTTGTAVRVGTTVSTGALVWDLNVHLPDVTATAKTVTGWAQVAGTVGVELCNLYDSTVHVGHVKNFETNLRCYGRGRGFVYNTVFLGQLDNGKVNLKLGADATGWCNENSFFVGHLSHQSGEGTSVSGTREIEIEVCTNPVNNNKFYSPSVEGNVAEYQLLMAGVSNRVISGRYEVTGGARVRWASDAARNLIDGGHNAVSIVESFAAGAAYTNELRANGRRLSNGYTWREGGSAAEGLDFIMDPGARVAGADRTTAYRVFRCGNYTAMKRAADTNDRLRFDHDNGRIQLGNGTFALGGSTCYIGGTSSGNGVVLGNGSLFFTGDNTYDLGGTGNRPRDLILGRNADMGGWARAIVHRDLSATPTFAAAQTVSFSAASVQYLTLTANLTSLTLSGGLADGVYELHLIQDGTGSRTLAGPAAAIKWAGGPPTLSTGAGKRDIFRFRYDGTNWYEISRSMNVG